MPVAIIQPIAFYLLGIPVHWYGIIIAFGLFLSVEALSYVFKKKQLNPDWVADLMLWAIPIGFLGARFYYVIFEWGYYRQHLDQIFAIWQGGIAIYGGVIAGSLTVYYWSLRHHLSPLLITDLAAPFLLMTQGMGRWGNFINQEAHGGEVSRTFLSDALHLPRFIVDQMQIEGKYYQPTFLYESIWDLIGAFSLMLLQWKWKDLRLGETTALYLIWYAFGRFFIEGMRTDSLYLGPFRVSQWLSLVLFFGGLFFLIYRRRNVFPLKKLDEIHGNFREEE